MRDLRELDAYRSASWERRVTGGTPNPDPATLGCFIFKSPSSGRQLRVLASSGEGWDHVSVSTANQPPPSWRDMETMKRLFFRDDEAAMQLHPPLRDYRNCHPTCLHIWRPHNVPIPLPPAHFVAPAHVPAAGNPATSETYGL